MSQQAPYGWKFLLTELLAASSTVSPRGHKTLELLNHTTSVQLSRPIVTQVERNLSYRLMAAEALWILSGDNRVYSLSRYAKKYEEFSDEGIFLRGAYGPKVVDQLPYIFEAFKNDLQTRQAVLTTWRERPAPSRDIPCTISMQFLIRRWELHMIVSMRSSDAWLGWPYDVFSFSMIAFYVALMLKKLGITNVILGSLWINAGSQHLYERDLDGARACQTVLPQDSPELTLTHLDHPEDLLSWLRDIVDAPKVDLMSFMP